MTFGAEFLPVDLKRLAALCVVAPIAMANFLVHLSSGAVFEDVQ